MQKDKVWILLGKKQSGGASDDEIMELERLSKEDESINFSEETIDKLWKAPLEIVIDDKKKNEFSWSRLERQINNNHCKKRKRNILIKRWTIAAGLALLLGRTLFFYKRKGLQKRNLS